MPSNESASSNTPLQVPEGKRPGSAGMVVISLILLAGLVWAMSPGRQRFAPAPLRPLPAGCPRHVSDFVPSDATEVAGIDFSALSAAKKNRILFRVNMEPCPCGCNGSIASCRGGHPTCPLGKELVEKVQAEETGAVKKEPESRSQ